MFLDPESSNTTFVDISLCILFNEPECVLYYGTLHATTINNYVFLDENNFKDCKWNVYASSNLVLLSLSIFLNKNLGIIYTCITWYLNFLVLIQHSIDRILPLFKVNSTWNI